jgi:hypothetical protein
VEAIGGRRVSYRRWCGIGVGAVILTHLLFFFVRVVRMITLPSPGGLRRPQLRSSKCFWVISSSQEVSRKASSSPEEKSTTENRSEGSPCSYGGDGGPQGETFGDVTIVGEDLVGEGGSEASLDEDPLTSAHERLMLLLFSIVDKWGEKEMTQSEK